MKILQAFIVGTVLLAGAPALAGGDYAGGPAPVRYCPDARHAEYLASFVSVRALRDEVTRRYEHAVDVANDPATIYSASPLHVWASEAKASCAQMIGYLKKRRKWRRRPDYVTLQKCDCFYDRMTYYLGR